MELSVELGSRSYPILLARGCLDTIGARVNLARKVLLVTDEGVPEAYVRRVLAQCKEGYVVTLPQGEASKSLHQFEAMLSRMLELGFDRKDAVLALGGGVVGDLAGFVAASYMRGVDFINCPTTTLAQVDSSIGGKVAVNLVGAKNTVGAFYQPIFVAIDPDTLASLPPRHYAAGLAEAVKAGLIADPALFALFEAGDIEANLLEILHRSLLVKKALVERDEREAGPRSALSFGHTLGHAIESLMGLGGLYHGECVALGMLPMIEDAGLRSHTERVYERLGLPRRIRYDGAKVFEFLKKDKKAAAGSITLVRVPALGQYRLDKVSLADLPAIIGEGIA
ncbi:MAG: 3-dehydroquinate synthase family protein [Candidatus Pelethousia sp.]|nr:3-dehydroquinate synthase family protein [Candidatus Pelethousia sp.]